MGKRVPNKRRRMAGETVSEVNHERKETMIMPAKKKVAAKGKDKGCGCKK